MEEEELGNVRLRLEVRPDREDVTRGKMAFPEKFHDASVDCDIAKAECQRFL